MMWLPVTSRILDRFVGPDTKVLAIHAHNPLGISYATDVYSKMGGENLMPLNAQEFLRIVNHPILRKYRPKIIVGGPGAWQLEKANRLDEFNVDYLIDGEIEHVFSDLFKRIIAGDPNLPRIIKIPKTMQPSVEEIPVVRHRSTFGVVEITRGCGRGCQFCSPATKVGRSFPLEHILESVRLNVSEGATEVMITSEDMFLYEQLPNFETNIPALENLFRQVISVPEPPDDSAFPHYPCTSRQRSHRDRETDSVDGPLLALETLVFYRSQ